MSILQSVDDVVKLFETSGCRYVVIDGIAVLLHGGRASTIDFDLYILAEDFQRIEQHLLNHGSVLNTRGEHQIRLTFAGIQIDILEADIVLAASIFDRSMRHKIVSVECHVATPEDIIILKTLADRPIDRRDIAELRELFAGALDEQYIAKVLQHYQ